MLDTEDVNLKMFEPLKPTATGTFKMDEDEALEIDLGELMVW